MSKEGVPPTGEGQEQERGFRSVGEITLNGRKLLFGVPRDQRAFMSYAVLHPLTRLPLATRDIVSLNFSSFQERKIGLQVPYYERPPEIPAKEYFEGTVDMHQTCTGTEITLHPLVEPFPGRPLWGWKLLIKHAASDELLEQLGTNRSQIYQGIERYVGKTETIPNEVVKGIYEDLQNPGREEQRDDLDDIMATTQEISSDNLSHPPLQEHEARSPLHGVEMITDKEVENLLTKTAFAMNRFIDDIDRRYDRHHPEQN